MGALPSGVTVVTTLDPQAAPHGFTCSAACSVSQDPPLLLVCVHSRSRVLREMLATGAFAVNILRDRREWVSAHFASRAGDRFASVAWQPSGRLGLPWLPDHTVACAECRLDSAITAGDHTVVIGTIVGGEARQARGPLMYWRREYAGWPGRDLASGLSLATEG
ncbi:flavin reductase family protein [Streptomyces sp. SB3404]|uniref:Flavin reductase family protein n=2 Tax=Streptomyces boncukensis TaxID=2711219 RepID=A0A6G4WRY3_9ACTN|nr:flavin reductase family protein [Streptomyces boncukensis]NGO67602.1 flavin reductase family protein [Streptomyces boncukensis]